MSKTRSNYRTKKTLKSLSLSLSLFRHLIWPHRQDCRLQVVCFSLVPMQSCGIDLASVKGNRSVAMLYNCITFTSTFSSSAHDMIYGNLGQDLSDEFGCLER